MERCDSYKHPTKNPSSRQSPRGLLNFYRLTTAWLSSRRLQSGFYLFLFCLTVSRGNSGSEFATPPGFPPPDGAASVTVICLGCRLRVQTLSGRALLIRSSRLFGSRKVKLKCGYSRKRSSRAQTGGNIKRVHLTPTHAKKKNFAFQLDFCWTGQLSRSHNQN